MSFEERYRKSCAEQDQSELMAEFGINLDQAVEINWRVARAIWMGIQIGSVGTFIVILMALGGWALWRGVAR